jgi:hypothetical protein
MNQFRINDYLYLKLENGKTNIYINNKLFNQCKYLLLNIPVEEIPKTKIIKIIEEDSEKLHNSFKFQNDLNSIVSAETQFWAHCSNLQAWYENDYNSCLIHYNLAFPLLKKLTKVGDMVAKRVFKDEIARRFSTGNLNIIQFLLENNYLDYLNKEEIEFLFKETTNNFILNAINKLKQLGKNNWENYKSIKNLLEVFVSLAVKYNMCYIFLVIENLPEGMKVEFVKNILFFMNFKDFKDDSIPYGKYYIFFEDFLDYIHEKYPKIEDLLIILETGYADGKMSLEEKLAYGSTKFLIN